MAFIREEGNYPPSFNQRWKVCIFCLKVGVSCEQVENVTERFLKFLGRLIGGGKELSGMLENEQGEINWRNEFLNCCGDCGLIISSFCELYHQLKCLELKLEWKLGSLVNIMRFANRVPSRMAEMKRVIPEETPSENGGRSMEWREKQLITLKSVRTKIIRKCSRRLSNSQPRVTLSRKLDAWNGSSPSDSVAPKTQTEISRSEVNMRIPDAQLTEGFLGWSMSLAAVTLLASMTPQLEATSNSSHEVLARNEMIFSNSLDKLDDEEDKIPPSPVPVAAIDEDKEPHHEDQISSGCDGSEDNIEEDFGVDPFAAESPSSPDIFQVDDQETDTHSQIQFENSMEQEMDEVEPVKTQAPSPLVPNDLKQENKSEVELQTTERSDPNLSKSPDDQNDGHEEGKNGSVDHSNESIDNRNMGSMQPLLKNEPTDSSPDLDPKLTSKSPPEPQPESSPSPSSSNNSQRYNLREKRGTSFQEMEAEVDPQDEEYHGSSSDSSSSSSNESDHSSGEYEMETTPVDTIKQRGKSPASGLKNLTVRGSPSLLKYCGICKRKINAKAYERHMTLHDTSGVDPDDIVGCSIGDCSAYFVKRKGDGDRASFNLYEHKRQFHKIPTSREYKTRTGPKRKFRCKLCKKLFFTKRDLEGHKKHHGSFKCQFCEVVKEFAPDLALHESEEHAIRDEETKKLKRGYFKLIPCSRCTFNCFQPSAFISHFLSVHLNVASTGKPFSCSICQAGFSRGDALETHFDLFHKMDGVPESEIFRCDLCPAYFLQGRHLHSHKTRVHLKKKCPECGKSYGEHKKLKDHLEQKHPDFRLYSSSTFICDIGSCRQQFPSEKALALHKKSTFSGHQNEIFKCDVCSKEFKVKKALNSHKYIVHREASLVCSECGKRFTTNMRLETHMTYHKGPDEWKFQCATCGRKFADKQKLDQHQRTHTKEKPFICQFCGEKYAHRHNWRNHVKTKHPEEFEQGGGK